MVYMDLLLKYGKQGAAAVSYTLIIADKVGKFLLDDLVHPP